MQGENYCMEEQVKFFKKTLKKFLRDLYPANRNMSDATFLINIGTSDYIFNYLQPNNYNSSSQYSGDQFAKLLTMKLEQQLKVPHASLLLLLC